MKKLTNAFKKKVIMAIINHMKEHPCEMVHNCYFRHYGVNYRIEEVENDTYKIFRINKYSIHDYDVCGYCAYNDTWIY